MFKFLLKGSLKKDPKIDLTVVVQEEDKRSLFEKAKLQALTSVSEEYVGCMLKELVYGKEFEEVIEQTRKAEELRCRKELDSIIMKRYPKARYEYYNGRGKYYIHSLDFLTIRAALAKLLIEQELTNES